MNDRPLSRHYGAVIEANSRPGPGRGPAPVIGPERWWWFRWRMFDTLLWDTLEGLDPWVLSTILAAWPPAYPSPESGLLSIRQMEWVRVVMIGGRDLDPVGRLFVGNVLTCPPATSAMAS